MRRQPHGNGTFAADRPIGKPVCIAADRLSMNREKERKEETRLTLCVNLSQARCARSDQIRAHTAAVQPIGPLHK